MCLERFTGSKYASLVWKHWPQDALCAPPAFDLPSFILSGAHSCELSLLHGSCSLRGHCRAFFSLWMARCQQWSLLYTVSNLQHFCSPACPSGPQESVSFRSFFLHNLLSSAVARGCLTSLCSLLNMTLSNPERPSVCLGLPSLCL